MDELRRHAAELTERTGVAVQIEQEGAQVRLVLGAVTLPSGVYALELTDVLFITDTQYPLSAMDMFYTEVGVVLASGAVPAGAESIETYGGRQWRRFSWHRNGVWNPGGNPLLDHYEFMQDRFSKDVNP